jgi:hypothetical protein
MPKSTRGKPRKQQHEYTTTLQKRQADEKWKHENRIQIKWNDTIKKRNLLHHKMMISKSYFFDLCMQDCYLCGRKPTRYEPNGVDRIDSEIDYTEKNTMPACTMCNFIKNNYKLSELLPQLRKIIGYWTEETKIIDVPLTS